MSRRSSILTAVIAAALLLLGAMPAGASPRVPGRASGRLRRRRPRGCRHPPSASFSIIRKDGNDVRGPLDLASMKISRGKTQGHRWLSRRSGRVSNAAIDLNNGQLRDPDRHQRRPPPFEYGQYVFFAGGKLRGVLVNLEHRTTSSTAPSRPRGPVRKAFRQVIQRAKIQSPGTYRHRLFAVYQASPVLRSTCRASTRSPTGTPLIPLDHRAPTFGWDDWETYSGDASDELTSPIEFHVADDRVRHRRQEWIVERREIGCGTPGNRRGREGRLHPTVAVPGRGGSDLRRPDHRDRPAEEPKHLDLQAHHVPVRRRCSAIYDPIVTQDVAATGWFLGTRSGISNAVAPGTATFTFDGGTGTQVCVMGGPVDSGTATADVSLDGGATAADDRGRLRPSAQPHPVLRDGQRQPAHSRRHGNQRLDVLDRRVLRGAVTHTSVRLAGSLSPASQRAITNNRSLRRFR